MFGIVNWVIIPIVLIGFSNLANASQVQEALVRHNYFRRYHDASPMTLNSVMSGSAQAYAQRLARRGILEHSSSKERSGHGENLAMTCGGEFTGATAVDMWYKEVCKYNFNNPGWNSGTGHFTQLVWKGSTELGIGIAAVDSQWGKCYYIVARYKEAGNMMGSFASNVAKGCFNYNSYCKSGGAPCG